MHYVTLGCELWDMFYFLSYCCMLLYQLSHCEQWLCWYEAFLDQFFFLDHGLFKDSKTINDSIKVLVSLWGIITFLLNTEKGLIFRGSVLMQLFSNFFSSPGLFNSFYSGSGSINNIQFSTVVKLANAITLPQSSPAGAPEPPSKSRNIKAGTGRMQNHMTVGEDQGQDHLRNIKMHKSMGLGEMHPQILRQLVKWLSLFP